MAISSTVYTKHAEKFLKSFRDARTKARIQKDIVALSLDPLPSGCKKLVSITGDGHSLFRIRCGNFRVEYYVDGSTLVIFDIGDRKDIYGESFPHVPFGCMLSESALRIVYALDEEAREAAEDAADEAAAQAALKEELADPDNFFHYCPHLWNP